MSNFTKKDTFCTQKTGNSVVVFLVHIKDITGFSFKKEIEKLISKETVASRCWSSETRKLGITQVNIRVKFSP